MRQNPYLRHEAKDIPSVILFHRLWDGVRIVFRFVHKRPHAELDCFGKSHYNEYLHPDDD